MMQLYESGLKRSMPFENLISMEESECTTGRLLDGNCNRIKRQCLSLSAQSPSMDDNSLNKSATAALEASLLTLHEEDNFAQDDFLDSFVGFATEYDEFLLQPATAPSKDPSLRNSFYSSCPNSSPHSRQTSRCSMHDMEHMMSRMATAV